MSQLKVMGQFVATLRRADGRVEIFRGRNMVVANGLQEMAKLAYSSTGGARIAALALGTASSAVVGSQTALQGTVLARKPTSKVRTLNQIVFTATFASGVGTGTIKEAGAFTSTATSAIMWSRFLTNTYTKGAADRLTLAYTITYTT